VKILILIQIIKWMPVTARARGTEENRGLGPNAGKNGFN